MENVNKQACQVVYRINLNSDKVACEFSEILENELKIIKINNIFHLNNAD